MRIDVLTLFPEMFDAVLGVSILGRAAEAGAAQYHAHNIRDWADNRHNKVDDRPFGGGPGMVMMCQPLFDSVTSVEAMDETAAQRVLLTPQGQPLDQALVEQLAQQKRLLLIAGHYEGVDERAIEELDPLQISIGDYVLSGGELPAMVLIDAVVRLLPGVLGHEQSAAEDSFALRQTEPGEPGSAHRLLDCPHYTRPRVWRGRAVPEVLISGDHQAVDRWRLQQMKQRTQDRRPDLLDRQRPNPPSSEPGG